MPDSLIIHYSEIGTKGKNRQFFEKRLIRNLELSLGKQVDKVYRRYGRIVCDLPAKAGEEVIVRRLERLPGIANFSFARKSGLGMNEIKKVSLEILIGRPFKTFRVSAKRSYKDFGRTSKEVNEKVGEFIVKETRKKVELKKPDLELFIEIGEKEAFLFIKKYRGIGGLPVGSSGKVVCSLSGGIDSPVAGFLMMKRGCKVVFIHICNRTLAKEGVMGKLEDIVNELNGIQLGSRLHVVPFEKIQKQIIMDVPAKCRMIVYRRFMMRIINRIAEKEKAMGIVTGDNVGQVASQTLENLNCIHKASEKPVFSPLIGMNKEEIIRLAKKTGTYEYSILPYPDCCSYMIAKHPETRGSIREIERIEESIKDKERLVKECVSKVEVKAFR